MNGDRVAGFERRNRAKWERFRRMASSFAKGSRPPPEEVLEFARLYRDVAADLSAARSLGAPPRTLREMNALVVLGHSVLYRERAVRTAGLGGGLLRFLLSEFPALVLSRGRLLALAVAFFALPALFAYLRVASDAGEIHRLFPSLEHVIRPDAQQGGRSIGAMPLFTSSILANNLMACFFTFASGILLGIGTAYILALNGILLGALAAHFANHGRLASFWPQVLPHGITELLAVFVSAEAGFLLAKALWRPGPWSRRDALVLAGREAARLLLGVAPLVVVSAVIEGYFTRSLEEDPPRNAFAVLVALAVAAWLLRAGADRTGAEPHGEGFPLTARLVP
ncbi:MAG TPA: stage II sporulation protein M [Planctomycetota bacterium]|nr:stage II sporulation protein M [Planctomycetota bacterium]